MKLLVLALLATACASGAQDLQRPTDDMAVVSVSAPPASPTSSSMTIPVMVEPAAPERPKDLAKCIAQLREGAAISPEGRFDAGSRDYEAALAFERLGQLQDARRTYLKLLQDSPKSAFAPYAYIAFGEMFALDAQTDPTKFEFAKQSYTEALKFSDPSANQLCHYSLSRIHVAMGNDQDALAAQLKVLQAPDTSLCGKELHAHARRDLVAVYLRIGQPDKAFAFLRRAVGNDRDAVELVTRLAEAYDRAGKTEDAQRAVLGAFGASVRSARLCALAITLQDRPVTRVSRDLTSGAASCKQGS